MKRSAVDDDIDLARTKRTSPFVLNDSSPHVKECCRCHTVKSITEYTRDIRRKDGLDPQCKQCVKHISKIQANSEHGFFYNLLKNAKISTKSRNKRGRKHEITLTLAQVKTMWVSQQGRCAITGVSMVLKPHSHFKCSIERKSNDTGYSEENCVLIISECNTSSQWTVQKAQYLFDTEIHDPTDLTEKLELKTVSSKKDQNIENNKWTMDSDGNVFCHDCNKTKPRASFDKYLCNGCKSCRQIKDQVRINSYRGALQQMYRSAKYTAKQRGMTFPLTFEELKGILIDQGGLCHYSKKPMSPKLGDFRMSIERLDVLDTYTSTNTVLICAEFQTGDRTRIKTEDSNDGCCGWSIEKYLQVQAVFNNKLVRKV